VSGHFGGDFFSPAQTCQRVLKGDWARQRFISGQYIVCGRRFSLQWVMKLVIRLGVEVRQETARKLFRTTLHSSNLNQPSKIAMLVNSDFSDFSAGF
jgi:hypothetical protein